MAVYHTAKNGNVAICTAKQKCRLGEWTSHIVAANIIEANVKMAEKLEKVYKNDALKSLKAKDIKDNALHEAIIAAFEGLTESQKEFFFKIYRVKNITDLSGSTLEEAYAIVQRTLESNDTPKS